MKSAPIQVSSIYFTDLRLSALPDHKDADFDKFDLEVKPEVIDLGADKPRTKSVGLSIRIKPDEGACVAYIGEIQVFGTFIVEDSWPEEKVFELVYINGAGILYAAAREMICSITARSPWDMLMIPSWSFSKMFHELQEAKKKEAESATQPPLGLTVEKPV
jgi:preprotein translocase subunit SecB